MEEKITNHTFVIMAYKRSSFLEDCIKSVINQNIKSNVIISTSTPNRYITDLADRYNLPLAVNNGKGDMADNWNFALSVSKTQFTTLCHQDDVYDNNYLKEISEYFDDDVLLIHTNWETIKGNKKSGNINSFIHKLLNLPVLLLPGSKIVRLFALSLGMSIKTPSVCYNKNKISSPLWESKYKIVLDWQAAVKIAKLKGKFIYINKPLFYYRVSNEAASSNYTRNGIRHKEDFEMFCKFWPKCIAKLILLVYQKSYNVYKEK